MSAWSCRSIDGKAAHKIVPPRPRIPCWKGPGADSEEKQEPASDIDIAVVDSLKVLDPNRPIREATELRTSRSGLRAILRYSRRSRCGLAAPHRLANLETLELRVIQIQRLVIPCPTMRQPKR